jgi:dTDP-4-amino-4,6-dideoxygalactose transaminase
LPTSSLKNDKMRDIPFNIPPVLGEELFLIKDAIQRRKLGGDGYYTQCCEKWLENRLGCSRALLTSSCTAALEMAALLLQLKPGDEVIMPSFTFSSTANAVALRGAVPVFADICPQTMNIDVDGIECLITGATKAIFVVHYAGRVPDMDRINKIARRHGLAVVEDAAQSLGSTYKSRPAGTHSDFAAISFHETKNVVCGEGGALIINNPRYIERAIILREKGTNRKAFLEGQVDKYTWVDIGSSFLPSEIVAAYLWCQLRATDLITADRLNTWRAYRESFAQVKEMFGADLPAPCDENSTINGHIFHLLLRKSSQREKFITGMKARGVTCSFHYIPLHSALAGRRFGRTQPDCPVCDSVSSRLVRLPLYYGMDEADVSYVVNATLNTLSELSFHS